MKASSDGVECDDGLPLDRCVEFCSRTSAKVWEGWDQDITAVHATIKEKLPPNTLVEDAHLLVDAGLQKLFFEHPARDHWPTCMKAANDELAFFRSLQRDGVVLPKKTREAVRTIEDVKKDLKSILLTDYALDKLLNAASPNGSGETVAPHQVAIDVRKKLKDKGGWDIIPEYIRVLIRTMIDKQAAGANDVTAAAAGKAGEHSFV